MQIIVYMTLFSIIGVAMVKMTFTGIDLYHWYKSNKNWNK